MAIVKMKRLTLLTPLEDRNALLRELQHLGCVALETVEEEGFRPITSDSVTAPSRYLSYHSFTSRPPSCLG